MTTTAADVEEGAVELFLTPSETAAMLAVDETTLARLRDAGVGPTPLILGRVIRYCTEDVDTWKAAHPDGAPAEYLR
ncbi:MAG: helix-turn-helix domain-containing protein [Microbacteriaceae bacterium]|nr:helix-turn-helix domain-containing protein [Microbacteriaceae bacterium]